MRIAALALLLLPLAACDSGRDDAVIVAYTGPEITEADALVPNPPLGSAGWSGVGIDALNGTFVTLHRDVLCGDECRQTVRFEFADAPRPDADGLPESVSGLFEMEMANPDGFAANALRIARVEIQDWGPEIYSGVVYLDSGNAPNIDPAPPTVFWTDDVSFVTE